MIDTAITACASLHINSYMDVCNNMGKYHFSVSRFIQPHVEVDKNVIFSKHVPAATGKNMISTFKNCLTCVCMRIL